MSNENSDQNDPNNVSRADDLLLDYFDEMFSSHSGAPKPQSPIASQTPASLQEPAQVTKTSLSTDKQENSDGLSKEDPSPEEKSDLLASNKDSASAKPGAKSNARHPNLKPASAILASKQAKPFKESKDTPDVVVAGLMPKLKPAAKQQKVEPDLEQCAEPKEEVAVATATPEQAVPAPEYEAEVLTAPEETSTLADPETIEQVETAKQVATEERLEEKQELEAPVVHTETKAEPEQEPEYEKLEQSEVSSVLSAEPSAEVPPSMLPPSKVPPFRELPEFEMLLFDVRGLQLAVPLISLGSIHSLEDDFTPIVGRADWYLGMYRIGDRNLQVVDTARWVMPSRMQNVSDERYEFVIRLADTNWALACSGVQQAIRVERNEIKWRTQQGKRPWLAGTVISKMCALLDVESMARLLDENKLQDTP